MTYLVCALTVYSIFKHRVQTAAAKVLKHLSGAIPPLDFERKNAQFHTLSARFQQFYYKGLKVQAPLDSNS